MEGGKRKWYENVSSALFMAPVAGHGWWLGHHEACTHTFYLYTYETAH